MKLDSVCDWMGYLTHAIWQAKEAVGQMEKNDDRRFDLEEEYCVLLQDTDSQLRMLVKRARTLAKQTRKQSPPAPPAAATSTTSTEN